MDDKKTKKFFSLVNSLEPQLREGLFYQTIDESNGYYKGHVDKEFCSMMNVSSDDKVSQCPLRKKGLMATLFGLFGFLLSLLSL